MSGFGEKCWRWLATGAKHIYFHLAAQLKPHHTIVCSRWICCRILNHLSSAEKGCVIWLNALEQFLKCTLWWCCSQWKWPKEFQHSFPLCRKNHETQSYLQLTDVWSEYCRRFLVRSDNGTLTIYVSVLLGPVLSLGSVRLQRWPGLLITCPPHSSLENRFQHRQRTFHRFIWRLQSKRGLNSPTDKLMLCLQRGFVCIQTLSALHPMLGADKLNKLS